MIHAWTTKRIQLLVLVAWVVSLVFSLPQVNIFSLSVASHGAVDCWGDFDPLWTLQLYITWFALAIYIVPFLMLVLLYGRICFVVWRSMRAQEPAATHPANSRENGILLNSMNSDGDGPIGGGGVRHPKKVAINPRAHVRGVSRAKVKTVKLTMAVITCYLFCWGPFFITQMWAAWDENAPFQGEYIRIYSILLLNESVYFRVHRDTEDSL